jgi:hypothetical protein
MAHAPLDERLRLQHMHRRRFDTRVLDSHSQIHELHSNTIRTCTKDRMQENECGFELTRMRRRRRRHTPAVSRTHTDSLRAHAYAARCNATRKGIREKMHL